jgi:hypothetical protein
VLCAGRNTVITAWLKFRNARCRDRRWEIALLARPCFVEYMTSVRQDLARGRLRTECWATFVDRLVSRHSRVLHWRQPKQGLFPSDASRVSA